MNIERRVHRLEAAKPEHAVSARVVFTNDGSPIPKPVPPLRPNEMLIAVNFVSLRQVRRN
jgi:hypothetical protein